MINQDQLDRMDGLAFATDQSGTIQAIGETAWNAFAADNGAPELEADQVVGRSLFDFIRGREVRTQMRVILDRLAEDPNWSWVLPYRCDAPDRKREMRQLLKPVFAEDRCTGYLFQSVEVGSQARPPIGLFQFKRLDALSKDHPDLPLVTMCSWCQRVRYPPFGEEWLEVERYYQAGGSSEVQLSHGLCDDCIETAVAPLP